MLGSLAENLGLGAVGLSFLSRDQGTGAKSGVGLGYGSSRARSGWERHTCDDQLLV
jgi:hypothetical protein